MSGWWESRNANIGHFFSQKTLASLADSSTIWEICLLCCFGACKNKPSQSNQIDRSTRNLRDQSKLKIGEREEEQEGADGITKFPAPTVQKPLTTSTRTRPVLTSPDKTKGSWVTGRCSFNSSMTSKTIVFFRFRLREKQ